MKRRRATDKGTICKVMMLFEAIWDFIDRRQIDAYAISLAILWYTATVIEWAMNFVTAHPEVDGLKAAAIIAAITGPWSALQGMAIKFLFNARQESFEITRETSSRSSTVTEQSTSGKKE
jgi:hypothetical protein